MRKRRRWVCDGLSAVLLDYCTVLYCTVFTDRTIAPVQRKEGPSHPIPSLPSPPHSSYTSFLLVTPVWIICLSASYRTYRTYRTARHLSSLYFVPLPHVSQHHWCHRSAKLIKPQVQVALFERRQWLAGCVKKGYSTSKKNCRFSCFLLGLKRRRNGRKGVNHVIAYHTQSSWRDRKKARKEKYLVSLSLSPSSSHHANALSFVLLCVSLPLCAPKPLVTVKKKKILRNMGATMQKKKTTPSSMHGPRERDTPLFSSSR